MKSDKVVKWGLFAAAVALSAMGCWFCWCHSVPWLYGPDQHVLFGRQVTNVLIGLVLFAGAAAVPWKWWLKSAPWLLVVWLALLVYAVGFCPSIRGSHRWAWFGPLRINVRTAFIIVSALGVAWLNAKRRIRPWMVFAAFGLFACVVAFHVVANANRVARVMAQFSSPTGSWSQSQFLAAFGVAKWFGGSDLCLRYLPGSLNDGMASASAIIFGKWFPVAVCVLFGTVGCLLSEAWKRVGDSSGRMFVLFWGAGMLVPSFYGLLQCVGLVPVCGASPVLAGYGGTDVMAFWIGLGILFSLMREGTDGRGSAWFARTAAILSACAVAVFFIGVVRSSQCGRHFAEPPLASNALGEFGTQAKRGEILAADGGVLAKAHGRTGVYLDPQSIEWRRFESTNEYCRTVAACVGLPESDIKKHCTQTKSRYVRLVGEADEETLRRINGHRLRWAMGLILELQQSREYPLGAAAAQVVGCVRRPTETLTCGLTGVEYTYDAALAGMNGCYSHQQTRKEKLQTGRPTNGGTVTTTLVPTAQRILAQAIQTAAATNGAESGWGIVMNAITGEISAMASYPTYDPVRDVRGQTVLINNGVQTLFEPGGLLKPFMYATALDAGLIGKDARIDVGTGVWEIAKTTVREACTGELTVAEALLRRSNIAAGKVGVMLGTNRLERMLSQMGFGRKVGGDTIYGEQAGIPFKMNPPETVTVSRVGMGRGVVGTGLQIANAYATLANGGLETRPHLVDHVTDVAGKEIFRFSSATTNRVFAAETAAWMTETLADAFDGICKENGIAMGGLRVVGAVTESPVVEQKTYSETDYDVAVAGFVSVKGAKSVVAIGFRKPQGDHAVGRVALPVFAEIVRKLAEDGDVR